MITFNPGTGTYGDTVGPAMNITDQAEADQYLKDYVYWLATQGIPDPVDTAKINLSYYSGYYSNEVSKRVHRLFCNK